MKEYVTLSLKTHLFFGRIMREHSLFLLTGFAGDYFRLLEEAREQDGKMMNTLTARTMQTTQKYQQFKTAGAEDIIGCEIRSIIPPLLADHLLREANHYLRILEYAQKGRY